MNSLPFKKIVFLLLVLVLSVKSGLSQSFELNDQPSRIGYFFPNDDSSVYTGMQSILLGNAPISYITMFPSYTSVKKRALALRDGEGADGYLLEGNIDLVFPIAMGRNQMKHWKQTTKLSFRYNPGIRMTLGSSNPIYPTNQKVGFMGEWIFWNSHVKKSIKKYDPYYYVNKDNWKATTTPLKMANLEVSVMHFSNGQPPGTVYSDSFGNFRNDYISGDFSTNYVNIKAVFSNLSGNNLFSMSLAGQRDMSFGGAFNFNDAQIKKYGQWRLQNSMQIRFKPKNTKSLKKWEDPVKGKVYRLPRNFIAYRIRLENEWILDNDLSEFQGSNKYRYSGHLFFEMNPLNYRAVGVIIHAFYGRDFFNIRYDDVVIGGGVGLSFTLSKYYPPRFDSKQILLGAIR
ncbi:MAG: hypothetical protein COA58_15055 [Bacteroidetes bacterium]|nr:MAG: hypothetical protein COA58_15055 [Bacteroidota bacterium]